MKRLFPGVFALLLVLVAAAGAEARPDHQGRWELLGSRSVSDRLDHDVIPVTAREGTFRSLRLSVAGRAVNFRSMRVHFGNGDVQEVPLRDRIRAGGSSRVIDIEGRQRVISRVEFLYDARTLRGRPAIVRLYGRH